MRYSFFLVILLIYGSINYYVGARALFYLRYFLPALKGLCYWPVYIFLACSFFLSFFLRGTAWKWLRFLGNYWQVIFLYLLLGFLLADLLRIAGRAGVTLFMSSSFLRPAGIVIFAAALGLTVYGAYNARQIQTVYYQMKIEKAGPASGLRVALISDLHIGTIVGKAWIERVVDVINEAGPDLVLIAGDIFDNDMAGIADPMGVIAAFRGIRAPYGVYACLGNHDVEHLPFGPKENVASGTIAGFLQDAGIRLLQDEGVMVADSIYIVGRKDASPISGPAERLPISALVDRRDKALPVILLDHQPVDLAAAIEADLDLVLCGHTHRGQVFPGPLVTRSMFLLDYGYRHEGQTQIVVSSGAGTWGPPVRVGTQSEVVIMDLVFAEETGEIK